MHLRGAELLASVCLPLLLGARRADAAVLPASFGDARRASWRAPWSALAQKTLGYGGDDDRDGLRWTSRGFASLGDSYSAGIGTHLDGSKEESCRLGFGAYPALLREDMAGEGSVQGSRKGKGKDGKDGGDAHATTFQWLSCTGATAADVLGSSSSSLALSSTPGQIDGLVTDPAAAALDYVTLSIGGNDLGFFNVINACVFRFYGYYSGTCEAALAASEALVGRGIDDDLDVRDPASFSARLTVILLQLLERARWEKRPRFRVVVTGYARFFNSETDDCDRRSMSVLWHSGNATGVPSNATDTTYLTKGLRRRMNGLVAGTNRKLRNVVDNVNRRFSSPSSALSAGGAPAAPRVLFVDYDAAFDGHRFCEPGVEEPDYARDDTWFFLVGGADNNATDPAGEDQLTLDPSSPLVDPARCRDLADARGDWGERALCDMVQAQAAAGGLMVAAAETADDSGGQLVSPLNSMWYVPTYYGKTFHPVSSRCPPRALPRMVMLTLQRSNGHKAVRDAVYRVWEENGV